MCQQSTVKSKHPDGLKMLRAKLTVLCPLPGIAAVMDSLQANCDAKESPVLK